MIDQLCDRFIPSQSPQSGGSGKRRLVWKTACRMVLLFALQSVLQTVLYGCLAVAKEPDASDAVTRRDESGDESTGLRVSTFDLDVTPPVGSMMAYDVVSRQGELGLRCRGIVISGMDKPVVLCAIDWIGISNAAHDQFRQALAEAAETDPSHVAVHALHQHDAPRCDFTAERLLHHAGATNLGPFESSFQRQVIKKLASQVAAQLDRSRPITHVGFGTANVDRVASNRRLQGPDGLVYATRYTTCTDPKLRAAPEGIIDPELSCLVFYERDQPIVSLTYYACHPQSYYRTGVPSPDFPGIARIFRSQDRPEAFHVHFNGAGGNIGAGKYNDGDKSNRLTLANRVADAMEKAFDSAERVPVSASSCGWNTIKVSLPPAAHLHEDELRELLTRPTPEVIETAPADLAWLLRCKAGHQVELGCLTIGDVRVLHLPGELFVEYQLAAKAMRKDLSVAMAAYGDYGPGYIGTQVAYGQGGYETSARASRVAPEVESVLMDAIKLLLGPSHDRASDAAKGDSR